MKEIIEAAKEVVFPDHLLGTSLRVRLAFLLYEIKWVVNRSTLELPSEKDMPQIEWELDRIYSCYGYNPYPWIRAVEKHVHDWRNKNPILEDKFLCTAPEGDYPF